MSTSTGDNRAPVYVVRQRVTGTAASTGVFAAIQNPHNRRLIITNRYFVADTQSTGASTLDIGVAANATTSADNLIDGVSAATAGVLQAAGTNGASGRVWEATQFVTVAEASGDVAGLVGILVIEYSFL